MTTPVTSYSPEFQRFLQLVETALIQSAADARKLAEQTGTPLIVRETRSEWDKGATTHEDLSQELRPDFGQ